MKKQNMEDNSKVVININGGDNHIYPTAATVNNFFGDQFAEEAMKANKKETVVNQGTEEKKDDPLRMFLKSNEDYEYVLEWAKRCKSPKDIYNSIALPLKNKGYGLEVTTNPPFIKALIPYLTNYTSSKNVESISRALRY